MFVSLRSLVRRAAAVAALAAAATPAAAQADQPASRFYGHSSASDFTWEPGCRFDGEGAFSKQCTVGQASVRTWGWASRTGDLHAAAWIAGPLTTGRTSAEARVHYEDTFRVRSEATAAFVRLNVFLHAALSEDSQARLAVSAVGAGGPPEQSLAGDAGARYYGGSLTMRGSSYRGGSWQTERTSVLLPLNQGVVRLGISLVADAFLHEMDCGPGGCGSYPAGLGRAAFADLSNTAGMESIEVLDADGNAITGYTLHSELGNVYALSGGTMATTTAPEPATVALLGGGLLGVAGAARRRRAASR